MPYQSTLFTWSGPSDSYLFPIVKEDFERAQVADEDQFFECMQEILRGLDQLELNNFF
jgi:hypothetical protein